MSIRAAIHVLCIGFLVWMAGTLPALCATRNVVLLFDERPELPGLAMLEAEFVRTLASSSADPIEVYREAMDLSRFGSGTYQARLADFLRAKYAGKKINVVVGVIGPALDFLLKYGAEDFPGASIIFCGIDRRELANRTLPPQVHGVLVKREFAPTLDLALKLHPTTTEVVVVAGSSDFDNRLLDEARQEFQAFEDRVAFTYLNTLPMSEVLSHISQLPRHTILLFTTVFRDAAGETFVPHDVVQRVSEAASVPVYGFLDQYLGRGIVGGSLYSFAAHGNETAKLVLKTLAGPNPLEGSFVEPNTNKLMFDWRQLQRWRISEARLPVGSDILFRDPSLWGRYHWYLIIGFAILLIEAAIIAELLIQRQRRRIAEAMSRRRTLEAIHLNRTATASALSSSVAHELGQPLTAILNFAAAAEIHLSRNPLDLPLLKRLIDEIQRSGRRAAQIISHLRSLLKRTDATEQREFDIGEVLDTALEILNPEALERQVSIGLEKTATPLIVCGDHVQLQQAILNLAINSMDAVSVCPPERRKLSLRTARHTSKEAAVSISDTGPGIPEKDLETVFDTFYTTKEEGTGIGLSITRTIIENHGGKIWAENNVSGGASFTFTLPLGKLETDSVATSTSEELESNHRLAQGAKD